MFAIYSDNDRYLLSPRGASTDQQGTLGINPRAGTNFVLGPLSDRILISGGPVVNGQYIQCKKTQEIYQVIVLLT